MPASYRPINYGSFVPRTSPSTPSRSQKRKVDSLTSKKGSFGLASSTTPYRTSSGQRRKEGAGNSSSTSRIAKPSKLSTTDPAHASVLTTPLAVPDPPKQPEMDEFLEAEMQGAIFCDPEFANNFLSVRDVDQLQRTLAILENSLSVITLPDHISRERQLYRPLCQILNAIKQAVDLDGGEQSGVGEGDDGEEFNNQQSAFFDVHSQRIEAHDNDLAGIKPDLVWFGSTTRHWETVRMPIEVKTKATHLKAGMKQLTRYARAVFAHQLHRRHLYGMVVCGWNATIVRFDRSGILYSEPMDVREEEFHKAFVGLIMLNEEGMGYDTAFTTRAKRDGRLEYYVDLPEEAFDEHEDAFVADASTPTSTTKPSNPLCTLATFPTRRLKVMRVLCHRKTIRGRATTVLCVRPVIRPGPSETSEDLKGVKTRRQSQRPTEEMEMLGKRDFVLKLMWRDPNKRTEGDVLERLVGIYGVGQHMWHSDVFKACASPGCGMSPRSSCGQCLDRTPDRDCVKVSPNLTNLDILLPVPSVDARDEEEPEYEEVETDALMDAYEERTSRTYCRLLMSTVGSPLCSAESPREFLKAVLDAILGYWKLLNMGLLHRDISDGNVLLLREASGYRKRKWREPQVLPDELDPQLVESEKLLRDILNELDDPTGMLNDYDLFALHGMMGASFFNDLISKDQGNESDSNDQEVQDAVDERGSKRRKLNSERAASPSSPSSKSQDTEACKRKDSTLTGVTNADKGAHRNIDYRTGTPSFMSIRILQQGVGRPYEHHFTDDLQSFFWLILWCAVEQVDIHGAEPTDIARAILCQLDQQNLNGIGFGKEALLFRCFGDGIAMRETLTQCGNTWASDDAVIHVILNLGSYFADMQLKRSFLACDPCEALPMIVNVFRDALNLPDDS